MKKHSGTVNTTLKIAAGGAFLGYAIAFYVWWEIDQMIKGSFR